MEARAPFTVVCGSCGRRRALVVRVADLKLRRWLHFSAPLLFLARQLQLILRNHLLAANKRRDCLILTHLVPVLKFASNDTLDVVFKVGRADGTFDHLLGPLTLEYLLRGELRRI